MLGLSKKTTALSQRDRFFSSTMTVVSFACLFFLFCRVLATSFAATYAEGGALLHEFRRTSGQHETKKVNPRGAVAAPVASCTKQQRDAVLERFYIPSRPADGTPTPLSEATRCPEVPWMESYFGQQQQPQDGFLVVNVGCNKGNDAIHMARMLSQNPEYSMSKWQQLVQLEGHACPPQPDAAIFRSSTPNKGQVHCIEAMPSTFEKLQRAWNQASPLVQSTLVLQNAAISNTTGTTLFPDLKAGAEFFSLSHCDLATTRDALKCTQVPMFRLDDYLARQNNNGKRIRRQEPKIDVLMIDTEGFDYEVLLGAKDTLTRARYVTFEVGRLGNWPSNSLEIAVHVVLSDFVCYWTGRNQVWRISQCTDDRFAGIYEDMKAWSNVACIHNQETELLQVAEDLFRKTIQG